MEWASAAEQAIQIRRKLSDWQSAVEYHTSAIKNRNQLIRKVDDISRLFSKSTSLDKNDREFICGIARKCSLDRYVDGCVLQKTIFPRLCKALQKANGGSTEFIGAYKRQIVVLKEMSKNK